MAQTKIILITEPSGYSPKALVRYRKMGPVYFLPGLAAKERARVFKTAEILVVRLAHRIDEALLAQMPALKIVASPTTGLNHIDLAALKRRRIGLISLRGRTGFLKRITSTAEETLGLLLALVRKLPWAFDDVKRGEWNRDRWKGHQLSGKTVGILGYGRLGKIFGRYAKALGCRVIAYDPYVSRGVMRRRGVTKAGMGELFRRSDVVSIHALLTSETEDLVQECHLRMMKPTAYLINTARAEIIAAGALEKVLAEHRIAGAAVDVMRDERQDGRHLVSKGLHRLAKSHHNVLIAPHIGGATEEAMHATEEFLADLVARAASAKI